MSSSRQATDSDREAIRHLYLAAFPEEESESVAKLAIELLDDHQNPGAFGLLVDTDGVVAGHVGFSPVFLEGSERWSGYILAPLAVAPDFQNRQLGASLVKAGMRRLKAMGVNLLFVYGDPAYYGRFGFDVEVASRYSVPYELEHPFGWQAVVLNDDPGAPAIGTLSCVPALRDPGLW